MNSFHRSTGFACLGAIAALAAALAGGAAIVEARNIAAAPVAPGAWGKSANPVMSTGSSGAWDDQYTFAPTVLLDGATYRMWYAGSAAGSTSRAIGYATSPDGLAWTRQGNAPVLTPGASGAWDAAGVSFASVIKDGDTYKMWFTGLNAARYGRIGYATSSDGVSWTKHAGNPVLDVGAPGLWDADYVGGPGVIKIGGVYHLWYRGGLLGDIGYATSSDGLNWTRYASNPVIAHGSGGWDDVVYQPRVIYDGAGFHMWYSGCNEAGDKCQVGYATSADGAHWARRGMVLPEGNSGAWDSQGADYATVMLTGDTLRMWYSGYDGSRYQIGYASSAATTLDRPLFLPALAK